MLSKLKFLCWLIAVSTLTGIEALRAGPIHDAAAAGDVAALEKLLADGADTNALDEDETGPPLHWALFANQTEAVSTLLKHGADPNVEGIQGRALDMAAGLGNLKACHMLLEAGADVNAIGRTTPLVAASKSRNARLVTLLIKHKADPNLPSPEGMMPLHEAARTGDLEIISELVEAGAKVNVLTTYGQPPIHFAALFQHDDAVAYLRKSGAEPGAIDPIDELLALADIDEGKAVVKNECTNCHSLKKGGTGLGPSLWNNVGRGIAAMEGYSYSSALQQQSGEWNIDKLNRFLARTREIIPGTKMEFVGIPDPKVRANVIAYLRTLK